MSAIDLGRLSNSQIVEKTVEAMPLLAYRSVVPDVDRAVALMQEIMEHCRTLGPPTPFIAVASHVALAQWLTRHACELAGPGRELIQDAKPGAAQTMLRWDPDDAAAAARSRDRCWAQNPSHHSRRSR